MIHSIQNGKWNQRLKKGGQLAALRKTPFPTTKTQTNVFSFKKRIRRIWVKGRNNHSVKINIMRWKPSIPLKQKPAEYRRHLYPTNRKASRRTSGADTKHRQKNSEYQTIRTRSKATWPSFWETEFINSSVSTMASGFWGCNQNLKFMHF
jgi:hypothetical protein